MTRVAGLLLLVLLGGCILRDPDVGAACDEQYTCPERLVCDLTRHCVVTCPSGEIDCSGFCGAGTGCSPDGGFVGSTVDAGPPSRLSLSIVPATLNADGHSIAKVIVYARNDAGEPAVGERVALSVSLAGNRLLPPGGFTDSTGTFTSSLTSTQIGTKKVAAKAGGLQQEASVSFTSVQCTQTVSFTPVPTWTDGLSLYGAASGDFNEDGMLDIVAEGTAASGGLGAIFLALGSNRGTFTVQPPFSAPCGSSGGQIIAGDVNGDGHLDIVLQCYSSYLVAYLGDGTGHLFAGTNIPVPHSDAGTPLQVGAAVLGDFRGRGVLDLAVAGAFEDPEGASPAIVWNNTDDGFGAPTLLNVGECGSQGTNPVLVAGDFNNDQIDDLVELAQEGGGPCLFEGSGSGTFAPGITISTPGIVNPNWFPIIAPSDVNSDGDLDLVLVSWGAGQLSSVVVLLGNGDGSFAEAPTEVVDGDWQTLIAGDFMGEGQIDLVGYGLSNANAAVVADLDAGFSALPWSPLPLSFNFQITVAGDFNGDGRLDLAGAAFGTMLNVCAPTAVPGPPLNVLGSPAEASAVLSWMAPDGGEPLLSYSVLTQLSAFPDGGAPSDAAVDTLVLPADASGATVSGLSDGATYSFWVFATNATGNGAATGAYVQVGTPGPPTNLTATVPECGDGGAETCQVSVSWEPPAPNGTRAVTDYIVQVGDGRYMTTTTHTAMASVTSYVGGVQLPGWAYVWAENSVGQSLGSNVQFQLPVAPCGPLIASMVPFRGVPCTGSDVCDLNGSCEPADYSASSAGTVTDNVTTLVWQRTVPTDPCQSPGFPGGCIYADAESYCMSLDLGGYSSGWHLPTVAQLFSLLYYGNNGNPAVDQAVFPTWTSGLDFLSSTTEGSEVWTVGFTGDFVMQSADTGTSGYVRCVHSP